MNSPHLEHIPASKLHVPDAPFRPKDAPDFSYLNIPSPEASTRPEVDATPESMRDLAYGLVRVLNDDQTACGPWHQPIDPTLLREGLKHMLHVRLYDERMFKMQRQGKLSFYMKSTGEEAVAVGQAMALQAGDMLFPTYRQQGLLFARQRPVVDMMCHCISNSGDNLKGRQMPVFYSWKEGNFFSISGNVATQYCQAVGWAMASAYKGENAIASAWVGDGSSAEADVYHALLFSATYKAPVILNVVNNQWAISTPQTFAVAGTTFAARGVGFNLPAIRVDGNDFLAVYAVTQWAAERARQGHGATLIELFTYRAEGHSTSDNPDAYRAKNEGQYWPLGDPIERLKQHLINLGEWSEAQHQSLTKTLTAELKQDWQNAIAKGSLADGPHWPVETLFDDVFAELPPHLLRQRQQLLKERG